MEDAEVQQPSERRSSREKKESARFKEVKEDEWVNRLIRVERTNTERKRYPKTDSPPAAFGDVHGAAFTAHLDAHQDALQRSRPVAVPVRSASMPADLDASSAPTARRRSTPRKYDPDLPSSVSPRVKRASPSSSVEQRAPPTSPSSSDDISANYSKLISAELIPSAVLQLDDDVFAAHNAHWIGDTQLETPNYVSQILPPPHSFDLPRRFYPAVSIAGVEYQVFDHVELRMKPMHALDVDSILSLATNGALANATPVPHAPSSSQTQDPGIARIVALFEESDGRKCVFLEWYYRKADVLAHLTAMKNYEEILRNPVPVPNSPSGTGAGSDGSMVEEKVRTPRRGRPPKKRRGNIEESLNMLETALDHEIFNAPKPHYTLLSVGTIAAPCFVEHIPLHLSASALAAAAAADAAAAAEMAASAAAAAAANASKADGSRRTRSGTNLGHNAGAKPETIENSAASTANTTTPTESSKYEDDTLSTPVKRENDDDKEGTNAEKDKLNDDTKDAKIGMDLVGSGASQAHVKSEISDREHMNASSILKLTMKPSLQVGNSNKMEETESGENKNESGASAMDDAASNGSENNSTSSESSDSSDSEASNEPRRYIYRRSYESKTCFLPGCKPRSNVCAPTPSLAQSTGTAFHPALHQITGPLSARSSLGSSGSATTANSFPSPSTSALAHSAPALSLAGHHQHHQQQLLFHNQHLSMAPLSARAHLQGTGNSFSHFPPSSGSHGPHGVPFLTQLPQVAHHLSSPRTPQSPHAMGAAFYGNDSATSSPRTPVTGIDGLFPFTLSPRGNTGLAASNGSNGAGGVAGVGTVGSGGMNSAIPAQRSGFMQLSASSPALSTGSWNNNTDEFAAMSPRTKIHKRFELGDQNAPAHFRSPLVHPSPSHSQGLPQMQHHHNFNMQQQHQPTQANQLHHQNYSHGSQTHPLPLQYHHGQYQASQQQQSFLNSHHMTSPYPLPSSSDDSIYSPRPYHHHSSPTLGSHYSNLNTGQQQQQHHHHSPIMMNSALPTSNSSSYHPLSPPTTSPPPQSAQHQLHQLPNQMDTSTGAQSTNAGGNGAMWSLAPPNSGFSGDSELGVARFRANSDPYYVTSMNQDSSAPMNSPGVQNPTITLSQNSAASHPHQTQVHHHSMPHQLHNQPHLQHLHNQHAPLHHQGNVLQNSEISYRGALPRSLHDLTRGMDPTHHHHHHHHHHNHHHGHLSAPSSSPFGATQGLFDSVSQNYNNFSSSESLDPEGLSPIVPTFELKAEDQFSASLMADIDAGAASGGAVLEDFSNSASTDTLAVAPVPTSPNPFCSTSSLHSEANAGITMDMRITPPPPAHSPPSHPELDPHLSFN